MDRQALRRQGVDDTCNDLDINNLRVLHRLLGLEWYCSEGVVPPLVHDVIAKVLDEHLQPLQHTWHTTDTKLSAKSASGQLLLTTPTQQH